MIVMNQGYITIDDYQDVTKIHEEEIVFVFKHCQVRLEGCNLQIVAMSHQDAKIKGTLLRMEFKYD